MTTLNTLTPAAITQIMDSLEKKSLMQAFEEPNGMKYQFTQPPVRLQICGTAAMNAIRHSLNLRTGKSAG